MKTRRRHRVRHSNRRRRSTLFASNRPRRRRVRHSNRRRRSSNPRVVHVIRNRRRRNPGFGDSLRGIGGLALWGTVGAIASRAIPATFMSSSNTGIMGYGMNLVVAVGGGMLMGKFMGGGVGEKFTAGGVIATALRIFTDQFSSMAASFGLRGDLDFYIQNSFTAPTVGAGQIPAESGVSGQRAGGLAAGGSGIAGSGGQRGGSRGGSLGAGKLHEQRRSC